MSSRYESGEKFVRVIQLFQRLSDTEAGLTTKQLANELEVTPRSVQRYIATLRDSTGLDIEEIDGRFRIGQGSRLPAMQLDQYQATQLLLAVRALQQLRPQQDPALVGALAQLSRALRVPVVSRYLEKMIESSELRPQNQQREILEKTLIEAFVQGRSLEIIYRNAEGQESKREVHPYFLEPRAQSRTIYLLAYDIKSQRVHTFRLERIISARLLPQTFTVPSDFDIDLVLKNSWGIWQGENEDLVVLRFSAAVADRVRETLWHPNASVTELPGGELEVQLTISSEVEMRSWVLGWGSAVEVIAPPPLREYIAQQTRDAAAKY